MPDISSAIQLWDELDLMRGATCLQVLLREEDKGDARGAAGKYGKIDGTLQARFKIDTGTYSCQSSYAVAFHDGRPDLVRTQKAV